jgi:hypothetical protein
MAGWSLGFEEMSEVAFNNACGLQKESGIGLPHSKTLARCFGSQYLRQVLECGCPLPLSDRLAGTLAPPSLAFSRNT